MSAFVRYLPATAELLPWMINLFTWLLSRSLNMPEPVVQATGLFVFVRVQDFENSVLKALCRSASCVISSRRAARCGDFQPAKGDPP